MDDEVPEARLVIAARDGDRRAFNELLFRHRDRLWGICYRVTGSAFDAEDAVQDCMVAIWRGLPRFRGDSAFSTWTYRIAANSALALVRRRREVPLEDIDVVISDGFVESIADRDEVQAALRTVPADFRVTLVLREYGGLSYEEIAAHQGILVQTVKSRLHRARTAMRTALSVLE